MGEEILADTKIAPRHLAAEFVNRADDPAYAKRVRDYAQRMLDWRLAFAERTLTHYRSSPGGLVARAN